MPVVRPPVDRPDWSGAAWAAGAGGLGTWALAAVAAIRARDLAMSLPAFAGAYGRISSLHPVDQITLAIPAIAGIAAAAWLGWLVARVKVSAEVAGHGGQLLRGAAAAGGEIRREARLSEVIFEAGGIKFTLDRLRRSFVILGSIGGGKTQIIWSLLSGLQKSGFRTLIVDGPKGDYSTSAPGPLLRIAPWHSGPAWHIAADCQTRAHARELALSLIPISDKDPIWGNAASMIFTAIICKLQAEQGTRWGWSDIYEHIILPIESLHTIAAQHYPPAAQALADAESKTTQSIVINLTAFMADVFELALAWRTTENRFSFVKWWRGEYAQAPSTVILQGSGEFKSLAGGYISSIINTLANLTASPTFAESQTRKNVLIIDEMAQLPRLAGVEKFLEIGRSKGCSAIFATQSPAQLRKIYSQDDLSSWLAMVGTKIFVRIAGADDAQIAMRELGDREVYMPTTSQTSSAAGAVGGSITSGWQRDTVAVVRQDQLQELGPSDRGIRAIVAGLGKNPILTTFAYTSTKPVRPAFTENPDFNRPISQIENAPEIEIAEPDDAAESEPGLIETPVSLSEPIFPAPTPAPAVYVIEAVADPAEPTESSESDEPGEEIEEKFLDVASDSIAEVALGGVGAHLLQLAKELQEVTAADAPEPTAAPALRTKKTLRKKRESEASEHA